VKLVAGSVLLLSVAILYAASVVAMAQPYSKVTVMGGPEGLLGGMTLGAVGMLLLVWGALTDQPAQGAAGATQRSSSLWALLLIGLLVLGAIGAGYLQFGQLQGSTPTHLPARQSD